MTNKIKPSSTDWYCTSDKLNRSFPLSDDAFFKSFQKVVSPVPAVWIQRKSVCVEWCFITEMLDGFPPSESRFRRKN